MEHPRATILEILRGGVADVSVALIAQGLLRICELPLHCAQI